MKFGLKSLIFSGIGTLLIGCFIGYAISLEKYNLSTQAPVQTLPVEIRENQSQYQFVNPLLYIGTDKNIYATQYSGLIDSLDKYISSVTSSKQVANVSVYLRDLNNGHWTGIGENNLYHPSSMLKVLTIMAASKKAEDGGLSFNDKLPYTPGDTNLQYYPPNDNMATGTYSIQDLLQAMVVYSDNGANAALLSDNMINDEFTTLYKLFRLPSATSSTADFMSARSYSVIWRTLYNASILSDSTSDQILHLLSYSTFKDGLVAGVPATTTVSHKFGEFTDATANGVVLSRELHDCGIVYYPSHPYFLCVMTRGTDFPNMAKVIAGASKIAYDFTASEYNK